MADEKLRLTIYEFIDYTKYEHFILKDFLEMKIGDTIDVVVWDGNFEERNAIWGVKERGKDYSPSSMYNENRHLITKTEEWGWTIKFCWGETFEHNLSVDVSHLPTYAKWDDAEEDGSIHITWEYLPRGKKIKGHWKSKHFHISELHENTRIGWRGPIMLWERLLKYDDKVDVFYK